MQAETLVLVPGLSCNRALFAAQIDALAGERPVVVADHARDDSVEAIARRLLDEAPERFALAGLSMGGYVALAVMRQAPRRVTRLALLDTTARPDTPEGRAQRQALMALAEGGDLAAVHERLWPKLVAPARQGDRTLEGVVRAMLEETGPEAFLRQQRAIMARPDSRPMLPEIEIPVLVLVGAEDAVTPPEVAREMAEAIEWASLTVVPGSGHLSTLEQPALVTEALRAWLAVDRTGGAPNRPAA